MCVHVCVCVCVCVCTCVSTCVHMHMLTGIMCLHVYYIIDLLLMHCMCVLCMLRYWECGVHNGILLGVAKFMLDVNHIVT